MGTTSKTSKTLEEVAEAMQQQRIVSAEELKELVEAASAFRKAQRRYDAVRAKIADAYDIEPNEIVEIGTGRVIPMPPQAQQGQQG